MVRRGLHLLLLTALLTPCSCGPDRREEAEKAFAEARQKESAGKYKTARTLYEKALALNPYHYEANLYLGALHETRLLDERQALYYYRRYLDLPPRDKSICAQVQIVAEMLDDICAGKIEDPQDAARDLLWAAAKDSKHVFVERLHASFLTKLGLQLKQDDSDYFKTWKQRLAANSWLIAGRELSKRRDRCRASIEVELWSPAGKKETHRLIFWLEGTLWELTGFTQPKTAKPAARPKGGKS